MGFPPWRLLDVEDLGFALRQRLGEKRYEAAVRRGQSLAFNQVLELALSAGAEGGSASRLGALTALFPSDPRGLYRGSERRRRDTETWMRAAWLIGSRSLGQRLTGALWPATSPSNGPTA